VETIADGSGRGRSAGIVSVYGGFTPCGVSGGGGSEVCKAFNCRILYGRYMLLTFVLVIISIPSPLTLSLQA